MKINPKMQGRIDAAINSTLLGHELTLPELGYAISIMCRKWLVRNTQAQTNYCALAGLFEILKSEILASGLATANPDED